MDKQPLLSLCIPTNGAVQWILPVIESIYAQGYDNEKFEVVITDNGKDSQLPEHIAKMSYPNLRYRQTTDEGFLNLVSSLKEGKGMFCKMINHRCVLLPGSIEGLVSLIDKYKESQPIIYCSDKRLALKQDVVECENTNAFVNTLSFWCSWSAGIGFWQKDIAHIDEVALNEMFPNASLLFYIRPESSYVICNTEFYKMGDDAGKGGYDLFGTFAVTLLDLLTTLRMEGRIMADTFVKVKDELYIFLRGLYLNEALLPTKHTFILKNIEQYMEVYYGHRKYKEMICWAKKHYYYAKIKLVFGIK